MAIRQVLVGALLATPFCATGQSFNCDLSINSDPAIGGGVPSDSFGAAANQPGRWNYIDVISDAFNLRNLDGSVTDVDVLIDSSNLSISGGGFANLTNTGDYSKLLNDEATIDDVWRTWTFHGLTNGTYSVTTYAVSPFPVARLATITVNGGAPAVTFGVMPGNQFIYGVTHVTQEAFVNNSTLTIRVSKPQTAEVVFCNGFQITHVVPEPAFTTFVTLALGALLVRRRSSTK